jgi:hypothetical protein
MAQQCAEKNNAAEDQVGHDHAQCFVLQVCFILPGGFQRLNLCRFQFDPRDDEDGADDDPADTP